MFFLFSDREKIARQNVFHFADAIRKTVGLSYKPGGRK